MGLPYTESDYFLFSSALIDGRALESGLPNSATDRATTRGLPLLSHRILRLCVSPKYVHVKCLTDARFGIPVLVQGFAPHVPTWIHNAATPLASQPIVLESNLWLFLLLLSHCLSV